MLNFTRIHKWVSGILCMEITFTGTLIIYAVPVCDKEVRVVEEERKYSQINFNLLRWKWKHLFS